MSVSNNYLIKALRAYRHITVGQFDRETAHIVPETQDAADEIERLNKRIDELEGGPVVSFDGKNTLVGMTSALRWKDVAKLIEAKDGGPMSVVTIKAQQTHIECIWEHPDREPEGGAA